MPVSREVARLQEQNAALQRQIERLHLIIRQQFDTVKELTDAKFVTYRTLIDSQAEKVALALDASERAIAKQEAVTERAISKQEAAMEKRFESVNEFRGQLADQVRTFMPRSEHVVEMTAHSERVGRLEESVRSAQIWQGNITGRLAVGGLVFTVVMAAIVFLANWATSK